MYGYFHTAGINFSVVHCRVCDIPLKSIYDPEIRDICHECGGRSKVRPAVLRRGTAGIIDLEERHDDCGSA